MTQSLTFEHGLDEGVLVELKEVDDDVVQVVEAGRVLQVLAHLEHAHQLGDIVVGLHRQRQLLPFDGRVKTAVDELRDEVRRGQSGSYRVTQSVTATVGR